MVAAAGLLVYQLVSSDNQMTFEPYAVVLCYYAAGRLIQTRRRFTLAVVVAVGVGALAGTLAHAGKGQLGSVIGGALLFAILPCAAGTFIARRAALTEKLAENGRQLELEHRLLASAVLGAERARIARELHDVVAHCVSVMVIQAGAARLVIGRDRGIALDAARVIEASGREAIDGIRQITGVRRREQEDGPPRRQPDLTDLVKLIERATAAGITTQLQVEGDRQVLTPDLEFDAYRIVQEALTNVIKHSDAASACVTVSFSPQQLTVQVVDEGSGAPKRSPQILAAVMGFRVCGKGPTGTAASSAPGPGPKAVSKSGPNCRSEQ